MGLFKKITAYFLAQFGFRMVKSPRRAILDDPDSHLEVRLEYVVYHHLEKIKERPFYIVQIGAYDGISFDDAVNDLLEDSRFQGLLVEPQPAVFNRLQKEYKGNGRVILENMAVAEEDGEVTLYTFDTSDPDLPNWFEGCASFDKEVALKFADHYPKARENLLTLQVPGLTLKSLLSKHQFQEVDYLQVDVEGFDYEVIKMVDFENGKPAIIRFEKLHLTSDDLERCFDLLIENGYKIAIEEQDILAYAG